MKPRIHYQSGFKYQLYYTYIDQLDLMIPQDVSFTWFSISKTGRIKIKKGYSWDGPSGPTADTLFPKLYKSFMRGALIHDVLYQSIRLGLLPKSYRKTADEILQEICIEDGMSKIRAWWVYHGVHFGAWWAASKRHRKKVLIAP